MAPTAPIPEITDKPPVYDSLIFRKSRLEVYALCTAGATDQTFLRNVINTVAAG